MNIPQLTNQEKGLICRALIESNPAFIEIIGQENGDGGRWEPFVDALALLLGVQSTQEKIDKALMYIEEILQEDYAPGQAILDIQEILN